MCRCEVVMRWCVLHGVLDLSLWRPRPERVVLVLGPGTVVHDFGSLAFGIYIFRHKSIRLGFLGPSLLERVHAFFARVEAVLTRWLLPTAL